MRPRYAADSVPGPQVETDYYMGFEVGLANYADYCLF